MVTSKTVYITIGNSDNKLKQADWASFCQKISSLVETLAEVVHGQFYTLSSSSYQSACFSAVFSENAATLVKGKLRNLAFHYSQDSIVWAETEPEFLTPA
jgi:hypothetical protein